MPNKQTTVELKRKAISQRLTRIIREILQQRQAGESDGEPYIVTWSDVVKIFNQGRPESHWKTKHILRQHLIRHLRTNNPAIKDPLTKDELQQFSIILQVCGHQQGQEHQKRWKDEERFLLLEMVLQHLHNKQATHHKKIRVCWAEVAEKYNEQAKQLGFTADRAEDSLRRQLGMLRARPAQKREKFSDLLKEIDSISPPLSKKNRRKRTVLTGTDEYVAGESSSDSESPWEVEESEDSRSKQEGESIKRVKLSVVIKTKTPSEKKSTIVKLRLSAKETRKVLPAETDSEESKKSEISDSDQPQQSVSPVSSEIGSEATADSAFDSLVDLVSDYEDYNDLTEIIDHLTVAVTGYQAALSVSAKSQRKKFALYQSIVMVIEMTVPCFYDAFKARELTSKEEKGFLLLIFRILLETYAKIFVSDQVELLKHKIQKELKRDARTAINYILHFAIPPHQLGLASLFSLDESLSIFKKLSPALLFRLLYGSEPKLLSEEGREDLVSQEDDVAGLTVFLPKIQYKKTVRAAASSIYQPDERHQSMKQAIKGDVNICYNSGSREEQQAVGEMLQTICDGAYLTYLNRLAALSDLLGGVPIPADIINLGESTVSDSYISSDMMSEAYANVAAVMAATSHLLSADDKRVSICLTSLPGHHASPTQASGFCFFNYQAIIFEMLNRLKQKEKPVMLGVDVDIHTGDGTTAFFKAARDGQCHLINPYGAMIWPNFEKPDQTPVMVCRTEHAMVTRQALAPGATYHDNGALKQSLDQQIEQHFPEGAAPDLIVLSMGVDGHKDEILLDEKERWHLETDDYAAILEALAVRFPRAKIMVVFEGGYNSANITACTQVVLKKAEEINRNAALQKKHGREESESGQYKRVKQSPVHEKHERDDQDPVRYKRVKASPNGRFTLFGYKIGDRAGQVWKPAGRDQSAELGSKLNFR